MTDQATTTDENKYRLKSISAVIMGLIVISALAAITDTILQQTGILPTGKFRDKDSALALSYHILYVIFGCYLTAKIAPYRPVAHSLSVGVIGMIMSILGLIAIIDGDLAPLWYGYILIIISIPISWFGGKLYVFKQSK